MSERAPQHIQNLVIRDYCKANNLDYLLHSTEYGIEDCFLIFNQLIKEIDQIDGIITYSMFQLPFEDNQRVEIYNKIIMQNKSIHFAVERISINNFHEIIQN